MATKRPPVILCEQTEAVQKAIAAYADALKAAAPDIGDHGLGRDRFWDSGLFRSAIERLRGQQAASMHEKRQFISRILDHLRQHRRILTWSSSGSADRHDYEVRFGDGRIAVIEAKGCLDGNNTNIFERPPHADEFVIWSLCQNPGADPRLNAWSGIHTRLSAEIMHRKQRVDGLVIWDMICGTFGRPCPKLEAAPSRATKLEQMSVPPPCIYLFPRSIPDPRSNPRPPCWKLGEVEILNALHETFNGDASDVVEVRIEADILKATPRRTVRLVRNGTEFFASPPTPIQRTNR